MSGTMQDLRRTINGAQDLQGVVRSMKALAASSIVQYERAVRSLDDYWRTVELGLSVCLRQEDPRERSIASDRKKPEFAGAVVFGSDQGLVGRFNDVVVDFAVTTLRKLPGETRRIWAVGERAQGLLMDSGLAPASLTNVPGSAAAIAPLIGRLLIEIERAREQGAVVEIYLFYNHPRSGAVYEPVCKQLLPLDASWRRRIAATPWPAKALPEVIGESTVTLRAFIRSYLFVLLYQACAESLNSENASRLAAMQRAEKNIEQNLQELTRTFHRIRQESIDEELFDVVSGFEALNQRIAIGSKRPAPSS